MGCHMRLDPPVAEFTQGAHLGYPYPKETLPRAGTACNTAAENTSMTLPQWTNFEASWIPGDDLYSEAEAAPELESDLPAPLDEASDRKSPAVYNKEHSHLTRFTPSLSFRHGAGLAVLVVLDCQNGFITEANGQKVLEIVQLTRRWMQAGRHVVLCRHCVDGTTASSVRLADGLLQAIAETSFPERVHVLDKGNCQFEQQFEQLLLRHGWDHF